MKKNKIFLLKVLSFFTFIFILSFLILLKKDIFLKLFGNLILFEDPIKNDDVLIQVIDNEVNINGGTDDDEIKKPLSTVLTTTQLGKLDNQNSETIQQAIKEKNESLDKDIQLVIQGMTETTAKVTASDYLGEVTVSYEIEKPLSTVLTTTQLGKLDNQNSETIQQAIKKANAPLEQSGLEIKEITETTAKVTASDYLGEVTVSYEIKKPLSTVLTTTQLGKLDNQNSETIQQAIKKANAPLEQSGLEIKEITETTAKVTASDYLGEVTVSYETVTSDTKEEETSWSFIILMTFVMVLIISSIVFFMFTKKNNK